MYSNIGIIVYTTINRGFQLGNKQRLSENGSNNKSQWDVNKLNKYDHNLHSSQLCLWLVMRAQIVRPIGLCGEHKSTNPSPPTRLWLPRNPFLLGINSAVTRHRDARKFGLLYARSSVKILSDVIFSFRNPDWF